MSKIVPTNVFNCNLMGMKRSMEQLWTTQLQLVIAKRNRLEHGTVKKRRTVSSRLTESQREKQYKASVFIDLVAHI